jgi:cytochrome c peroxidase
MKILRIGTVSLVVVSSLLSANAGAQALPRPPATGLPNPVGPALSRLEQIGERLFSDRNLSEPAGTACISCHAPNAGFAGNNGSRTGVARGSQPTTFGLRNSMSAAYNAAIPRFSVTVRDGKLVASGGHFWDGRAETLAAQALIPFLSAVEMNNPDSATVVRKVAASNYANLFSAEFGPTVFANPTLAFQRIGEAIAAFEASRRLQPFSSKYDQFIAGQTQLADNEARGMRVFMDPQRGNCAACHSMNPASANPRDSLFSDFSYHTLGIPRNPRIAENANPSFYDLGLCGPKRNRPALGSEIPANFSSESLCGAFRVVSLRNVAQRPAFMHNGVFRDLREVVGFYATRNSDPRRWYGASGVANDLPAAYLSNVIADRVPFNRPASAGPALSRQDVDDIVAFLGTLSDGFAAAAPAAPVALPAGVAAPNGLRLPFFGG